MKRSTLSVFSLIGLLGALLHFTPFAHSAIHPFVAPQAIKTYVLYGYVPGEYVGKDRNTLVKAAVSIAGSVIVEVKETATPPASAFILKRDAASDYDVIYPGLFNLHNHTKQNVLSVWKDAKGQFQNRFEWRGWGNYKDAVSGNMNPWIGLGAPITCASFRYSELQAMALGTTYLQGPSSCVSNFAINRIEDSNSFLNYEKLPSVQAPTDLIYPNEMTFVWKEIVPIMMEKSGAKSFDDLLDRLKNESKAKDFSYEVGLQTVIKNYCPDLVKKFPILGNSDAVQAVSGKDAIAVLKISKNLDQNCRKDLEPSQWNKMRRYTYFIHPSIAGKKNLLSGKYSAIVAHLAEGRRLDPYNRMEFKLLRLLGLDKARVNLIHGVGVDEAGFRHMAERQMGLVWSPFSNHLLYNETVDIETAVKVSRGKLLIGLGSDWTPTGSRGTLEEAKMARRYLIQNRIDGIFSDENGRSISVDEAIYKMITSNPAKMLGHEGEAGTIAPKAAASLIVTSKLDANPYTNLVYYTDENQINLVIVDGKPVYGNLGYILQTEQEGITPGPVSGEYEDLGIYFPLINKMDPSSIRVNERFMKKLLSAADSDDDQDDTESLETKLNDEAASGSPRDGKITAKDKLDYLFEVGKAVSSTKRREAEIGLPEGSSCRFSGNERKVFVPVDSKVQNKLVEFAKTGLDLDKVRDIVLLLQGGMMTHSRNKWPSATPSAKKAAAQMFSPVYSCQDRPYLDRIGGSGFDATKLFSRYLEEEVIEQKRNRSTHRKNGGSETPRRMAESYGLTYSDL
jgi:cytosine/adenosine deaminase-related metal-dependent hydrolase